MATETLLSQELALEKVIAFLFVMAATFIIGNIVYMMVRRSLERQLPHKISKLIARFLNYSVLLTGTYYGVYYVLELEITPLFTSLGIVGVAVALSSQEIIKNFIAGIMISTQRPIQIDDWVEIGGIPSTGINKVRDITLMRVTLRDRDGKIIYIPNSMIITSKVINYTKAGFIGIPVELTVPYDTEIERIKEHMLKVAEVHPRILPNIHLNEHSILKRLTSFPQLQKLFDDKPDMLRFKPKVLISEVDSGKIKLTLRVWISEINKREEIVSEYMESLLEKLKKDSINIRN